MVQVLHRDDEKEETTDYADYTDFFVFFFVFRVFSGSLTTGQATACNWLLPAIPGLQ